MPFTEHDEDAQAMGEQIRGLLQGDRSRFDDGITDALASRLGLTPERNATVEDRFFVELDELRDKDPTAFAAVSPGMKVAYAEWKRERGSS